MTVTVIVAYFDGGAGKKAGTSGRCAARYRTVKGTDRDARFPVELEALTVST